jgi:hypothetical protein
MELLTPTPEVRVYVIAAVVVYALACAPLAAYVLPLWPSRTRPGFMTVYVLAMLAVAAVGLLTLSLPLVTDPGRIQLALSLPVGLLVGAGARWADVTVTRAVRARRRHAQQRRQAFVPFAGQPQGVPPSDRQSHTGAGGRAWDAFAPRGRSPATVLLALLICAAALEELLFRGILADLCLALPPVGAAICLAGTTAAFALAHSYLGWHEVLAKLPLGAGALTATLALETVAAAVVAHVLVNVLAWSRARESGALQSSGAR